MNLLSLEDMHGDSVRKNAKNLLDQKYYDFSGTDIHGADMIHLFSKTNIHKYIFKLNKI